MQNQLILDEEGKDKVYDQLIEVCFLISEER